MGSFLEEAVTLAIAKYLEDSGWEIRSIDFPNGGGGHVLRPSGDASSSSRNEGNWVPDIIAQRRDVVLIVENKGRFIQADVAKVREAKRSARYVSAIRELERGTSFREILFGIGFGGATPATISRAVDECDEIDVLFVVEEHRGARVQFCRNASIVF